jgi:carbonic anhydrase
MNEIFQTTTDSEIIAVRELFEQYSASLPVDLTLQHIGSEMASLPGSYAAPRGALFLARADGSAAGCIGLRPFSETVGELKRLYVIPAFRSRGLARALISTAIAAARSIGYKALVLDSLASMRAAISLYESFGFRRTEPYWSNPFPNVLYFRLPLEPGRTP